MALMPPLEIPPLGISEGEARTPLRGATGAERL
jgi:hypothetical protein